MNFQSSFEGQAMKEHHCSAQTSRRQAGFTLIELMIVIAMIAVIVSLALPVYTSYTIRAKVGEALSVAAAAKTAVSATCIENPTIDPLTDSSAGYSFTPSKYVASIGFSGSCRDPVITVITRNTGAPAPINLVLTGDMPDDAGRLNWVCTANTANRNVPAECRS
jgi:prepilin-type N-terminal cleavage/methylation domain-containing protein